MKIKSAIIFALLFVLSFSVTHTVILDSNKNSVHCDEFENSHDDEDCEVHCEFHQAFVLLQKDFSLDADYLKLSQIFKPKLYYFQTHLELLKPPIA